MEDYGIKVHAGKFRLFIPSCQFGVSRLMSFTPAAIYIYRSFLPKRKMKEREKEGQKKAYAKS
jgi:hypothetical protein